MFKLYNSKTKMVEEFSPIDESNVRVYYCGPTVYSEPHIGNFRAFITADILVRILKHLYPKVTYVRNITDIDDKIINLAGDNYQYLTKKVITEYKSKTHYMNLLEPDVEPLATEHIGEMIEVIQNLIDRGHAYVNDTGVYFDSASYEEHGILSSRDNMEGISNPVDPDDKRKNRNDFVLWKLKEDGPLWDSPWGKGRPGWHTECVAMSRKYLGDRFDIHGGGKDLFFPHHENENAQCVCSTGNKEGMANFWVHNSFVTTGSEKMSKSRAYEIKMIPNYVDEETRVMESNTIRMAFLSTHYRRDQQWSEQRKNTARGQYKKFVKFINKRTKDDAEISEKSWAYILNDMNFPGLISRMITLSSKTSTEDDWNELYSIMNLLGFIIPENKSETKNDIEKEIEDLLELRKSYRDQKDWKKSDEIRNILMETYNVEIRDTSDGTTYEFK